MTHPLPIERVFFKVRLDKSFFFGHQVSFPHEDLLLEKGTFFLKLFELVGELTDLVMKIFIGLSFFLQLFFFDLKLLLFLFDLLLFSHEFVQEFVCLHLLFFELDSGANCFSCFN